MGNAEVEMRVDSAAAKGEIKNNASSRGVAMLSVAFLLIFGVAVRAAVALHPYSGTSIPTDCFRLLRYFCIKGLSNITERFADLRNR